MKYYLSSVFPGIFILFLMGNMDGTVAQSQQTDLTLNPGIGYLVVTDAFISEQPYQGVISGVQLSWLVKNPSVQKQVTITYRQGWHLHNYRMSARIDQFSAWYRHLYSIGRCDLLNKPGTMWMGVLLEFFGHQRRQKIGRTWLNPAGLGQVALKLDADLTLQLAKSVQLQTQTQLMVFSVIAKTERGLTSSESSKTQFRLLPNFEALDWNLSYVLVWQWKENIYLSGAYEFVVKRLRLNSKFLLLSDFWQLGLGVRL